MEQQKPQAGQTPVQQQEREKGLVIYSVAGQDVKLSYQIVRSFLTKGNG